MKFSGIAKNYKKLCEKYLYQDEEFIIRPAKSAGEIVEEGRILHHCVGGNDYLNKHNKGITYILFLRVAGKADAPYVTVEIDTNNQIRQWYGAFDKKPDEEHISGWLEDYIDYLNTGGNYGIYADDNRRLA